MVRKQRPDAALDPAGGVSDAATDAMERVRSTYDAVAERYADAMVNELHERPIERGLLDAILLEVKTRTRDGGRGGRGGPIVDVGCGPGHVTRWLADRMREGESDVEVLGLDLSPAMIDVARARFPGIDFRVGSVLAIDASDASWGGAVALYSIIHFTAEQRRLACHELARVLVGGAPLLVSFHVSSADHAMSSSIHLENWFDTPVDLTGYFLDPDMVLSDLRSSGFELRARLDREPLSTNEFPSRRCYLLLRRGS